jgi:hypothetical protein
VNEIRAPLTPPVELRLHIYELTTLRPNTSPIKLTNIQKLSEKRPFRVPAHTDDWSKLKRPFLGLAQTCRQLRAEYLAVHDRSFTARVQLCDLHAYLTQLVIAVENDAVRKARSRIHVYNRSTRIIDIYDLVLLCSTTADLDLILSPRLADRGTLQLLFSSREHPKWWEYLIRRVSMVELHRFDRWEIWSVRIALRPEFAEEWMSDGVYFDSDEERERKMVAWRRDVSMDFPSHVQVTVDDEKMYR